MFSLKLQTTLQKKLSRNKKFVTILLVLLLVGVSGCTTQAQPPAQPLVQNDPTPTKLAPAPTPTDNEVVELRIAWWGSQNRHDRTSAAIKLYESQNPKVKITYEFAGWGDYWAQMDLQATGDHLPDIMQQDYARLPEWVTRGELRPLDEYVGAGLLDFSHVPEVSLAGGRLNDRLYGVSLGINSEALLLDIDAFEKAEIKLPAQDWTWQDFEKITLDLHKKLGIWGMGYSLSDAQLWRAAYLGHGQSIYAEDGTRLGYTDDQILIDYFKMLIRLQEAGAIPTIQEETAQFEGQGREIAPERAPLVSKKAAMAYLWSNQIVAFQVAAGETRRLKLVHLPRPEDGQPSNYVKPAQFFSITSNSQHPEEAAKFINWFTNSIEANEILLAERGVPISTVVQDGLQPLLESAQLEMFDYLKRVQNDSSPLPKPDPTTAPMITGMIYNNELVDPVLLGLITPEDGVALFREFANKALSEPVK